jgi:hypothetical protein
MRPFAGAAVSFFARHTFCLLSTSVFVLFLVLVLLACNTSLEKCLGSSAQVTYPENQQGAISAYFNLPGSPNPRYALAGALTSNPFKQFAFFLLLSLRPEPTILTAYGQTHQFGPATGLPAAAQHYFGLPVQHLSLGETLLLLDLAHNPASPISDPAAALVYRDSLLRKLYARQDITESQFAREQHKALALAADHRPSN